MEHGSRIYGQVAKKEENETSNYCFLRSVIGRTDATLAFFGTCGAMTRRVSPRYSKISRVGYYRARHHFSLRSVQN